MTDVTTKKRPKWAVLLVFSLASFIASPILFAIGSVAGGGMAGPAIFHLLGGLGVLLGIGWGIWGAFSFLLSRRA